MIGFTTCKNNTIWNTSTFNKILCRRTLRPEYQQPGTRVRDNKPYVGVHTIRWNKTIFISFINENERLTETVILAKFYRYV